MLTAVRWAVDGQPRAADLDLVGRRPTAPVAQLQVPGAADELSRVEAALGERHDHTAVAVGEQPVDVALGFGEPVGNGRVAVARPVDRAGPGEVGRVVGRERLQLHVGAGQRERLDGRRHQADRSQAPALCYSCVP